MKTLLIGANGSMGTRYQAIFKDLGLQFTPVDKETSLTDLGLLTQQHDRVLLCSPTDTHGKILRKIIPLKKPILCEKPIVKDSYELETLFELVEKHNTHFQMVFQYGELIKFPHLRKGRDTEYNYFRSGKDGLVWDCLQIIALANDEISLRNDSPIWRCKINGTTLDLSDMDYAYHSFIKKWTKNGIDQNLSDLFKFHKKTEAIFNDSN